MTDIALVGLLSLTSIAAAVAVFAAVMTMRHSRDVSRRLHAALKRLDEIFAALPDPETPREVDALRVELEWLVDTITNELVRNDGRAPFN
jgi:hypothetical protein